MLPRYLLDDCGLEPHRVVVYGRSIGSGPTVDVASRTSGLGGMILQSPIASAGHVVLPEQMAKALAGFDLFKNYEKIKDVTCRTLMIHGRADTMVPFEHAQMLFPELRNQHPPLWIDGAGHHDMPDDLCLNAVANFVAYIEERNAKLYGRASSPDDDPADGDGRGHWLFGGVAALFGGGGS